jgi:hypothetical protein
MRSFTIYGKNPLTLTLILVGAFILSSAHADTTFQMCVNDKCEIVADYGEYQHRNTCVNEDCSGDLPTNSSIDEVN